MLAIVLCNINRTNMKCICLIKLENVQCNLRSLENVNNEREMPQDGNLLSGGNVHLCSLICQESGLVHSYKII